MSTFSISLGIDTGTTSGNHFITSPGELRRTGAGLLRKGQPLHFLRGQRRQEELP